MKCHSIYNFYFIKITNWNFFSGLSSALKFHFISHSLSFGNQKDSRYNEGHTIICKVEDSDIECCLLVTEGDNAQAEALEQGNVFTSTVHVLDYDSLYQRIIFGNEGPLQVLGPSHENESRIDESGVK